MLGPRARCWSAWVLGVVALAAGAAPAADWPQYRGPQGNGISTEAGWNANWPAEGPRVLWRASFGPGASSMAIAQGKMVTMGNVRDHDIVYCLEAASGKELWRFSYPCPLDKRMFDGGPAATPTIAGQHVYTISHRGDLYCLDLTTGKQVWRKSIPQDLGGRRPQWGWAGSALADGDRLYLDVGGNGSSTVALNRLTGAVIWQAGNDNAGYATPALVTIQNQPTLLMFKAKALVALDPANGQERWRTPWETSYDVNAANPLVQDNLVFISSGYNTNMRNHMATSILHDGHIYGIDENQIRCLELTTGNVKWTERVSGKGTLTMADGKLIVLSERGELLVAPATPTEFKPTGGAQVLGGRCWVMPVLSGGRIFVKNNNGEMVCLDVSR